MANPRTIDVRRVYDAPDPGDGYRALVDRLWPRGLTHQAAALDEWCRDIAPSTELRRWYGHDPDRSPTFRTRYLRELNDFDHAAALAHLQGLTEVRLTLLTATRILADRLSGAALALTLTRPNSRSVMARRKDPTRGEAIADRARP